LELLDLCARAGITHVFIGIESLNPASLRETQKRQNLFGSLGDHVHTFLEHGIMVTGGLIVGFGSDELDIFEQQLEFSASMPMQIFTAGILSPLVNEVVDAHLPVMPRYVGGPRPGWIRRSRSSCDSQCFSILNLIAGGAQRRPLRRHMGRWV
jgi:hypothetical protein